MAVSGDLVGKGKKAGWRDNCYNCGLRSTSRGLPADEGDLVPLATIFFVFKVVDSPPTLGLWEITEEILVIGGRTRLVDDDLGIFFVDFIGDVPVSVTKLESLELGETFIVDGYARCLEIRVRMGWWDNRRQRWRLAMVRFEDQLGDEQKMVVVFA